MKFVIVGAGLWGCVMAERIASVLGEKTLVIDRRAQPGGNCASFIDESSGVECHAYGSHIFHTSLPETAEYLRCFCALNNYRHKVLTTHKGRVYAMPINLFTINAFYNANLSPSEAEDMLRKEAGELKGACRNLEEKTVSQIGRRLYEAFIRDYTAKQWGKDPKELPAEIINRLPVRYNYNIDYFNDPIQGIPLEGYARLFERLLDSPLIELRLNCDYKAIARTLPNGAVIIYTGMVDELFDYKYGHLEWRSLDFEWEKRDVRDFQGTAVMNYADADTPFTRIHEFKHYHPERRDVWTRDETIICREYPKKYEAGSEAYYPVNDERNNALYQKYAREAEARGIILGGRLGAYKYWDMDKAIANALQIFREKVAPMGQR